MKKLLTVVLLLAGLQTAALAQCDPGFGLNPTYTGTQTVSGIPTILVGETGQLHFTFGVGTSSACNAAAYNTTGAITLVLAFTNNYTATSASAVSGPWASLFNWEYDAVSHVLIGTSNVPLPVGPNVDFTVNVVGTAVTSGTLAPLGTLNYFSDNNPPITNTDTGNDTRIAGINVDAALPVTLVSFLVSKEGKLANLRWSTTAETNSDRFEIEHSADGSAWKKIGIVASNGESKALLSYGFTDRNPVEGENLYRLRMVDKDETFAYSRIQSIRFEGLAADLSVYPNPVTEKFFVRDFNNVTKIIVYDMSGRSVHESAATTSGEINVKNLRNGMYLVKVTRADGGTTVQRIVINK